MTVVKCGKGLLDYSQGRLKACPACGWSGSEEERVAFIELEQAGRNDEQESKSRQPTKKQVFVSYAPSDASYAQLIAERLADSNCIVWVDIHVEPGIEAQDEERKKIDDAFHRCAGRLMTTSKWLEAGAPHLAIADCIRSGAALFLISDAFVKNPQCRFLATNAIRVSGESGRKRIILVIVGKFDSTLNPEELRGLNSFDLTTGPVDQRVEELIRNLKTLDME